MSETSADQQGDLQAATPPKQPRTEKFRRRQADIIRAAISLINKKGVSGMTLVEVASQLGIVPTGVIYYFPNKEQLAGACFLQTIGAYEDLIAQASAGDTPRDRLGRFVRGYVALAHDVASGRRDPLTVFNDVRALNDPIVNAAYTDMFRHARSLIDPTPPRGPERQALNAATHLVLSQLFWSVVWLPLYDRDDYGGIAARMLDVLDKGLAADSAQWPAGELAAAAPSTASEDVSRETFLRAATQIINEHGYLGASVDRISSRLNVTKGSFYHHNEAKDDLVVACFRRTLDVMRRAQRVAMQEEGSGFLRVAAAVMSLVHCQVSGQTPLLRTSALTSAPEAMQRELIAEFDRVSLAFSLMISGGVMDGSVRAIDAYVAAQMVTGMVNAAAELEHWVPGLSPGASATAYVRALLNGVPSVTNPGATTP